jgi:Flp pilus assembly protein TadD
MVGNAPMEARAGRVALATLASLLWLNGCETSTKLGSLLQPKLETTTGIPPAPDTDETTTSGQQTHPAAPQAGDAPKGSQDRDSNDNLSLGKKHFRAANFGLAERHFRRAVEQHPRDLESWIGLAASYDRLRRWDRADRAYDQAVKIGGASAELLNNRGYSYMLRGDYRRARDTLMQAHALDPANPYIKNNLELLEASARKGKGIQ